MDHFGPIDHYTANNVNPDEPSHQITLYFPFSYNLIRNIGMKVSFRFAK